MSQRDKEFKRENELVDIMDTRVNLLGDALVHYDVDAALAIVSVIQTGLVELVDELRKKLYREDVEDE